MGKVGMKGSGIPVICKIMGGARERTDEEKAPRTFFKDWMVFLGTVQQFFCVPPERQGRTKG